MLLGDTARFPRVHEDCFTWMDGSTANCNSQQQLTEHLGAHPASRLRHIAPRGLCSKTKASPHKSSSPRQDFEYPLLTVGLLVKVKNYFRDDCRLELCA